MKSGITRGPAQVAGGSGAPTASPRDVGLTRSHRRRGVARRLAIVAAAGGISLALAIGGPNPGLAATSSAPVADDGAAAVIAKYQARIPGLMAEQGIPGLAVALVDREEILWTEGFGHTDREGSAPITVDTIFSVQSMSKNFTATAVMEAVQAGLLDLDEPITTYLPDFTVHSAFEDRPERKITLRMLLSHTAGFTHEAPIGNNYELDPRDFDTHVLSISDTWLRFPVGTGYAYSNLGIDLAGYILERTYGTPFPALMRASLLEPLGMDHSTFDHAEIRAAADRAVGHTDPVPDMPIDIPMAAAGGLYSSAGDLAQYIRFQLNDGTLDGRTILDRTLIEEMRTVPAPRDRAAAGYALGVTRYRWVMSGNADLFSHGGGGFGFLSDLWWSPPLGVGIAVLTNSADHDLQGALAVSILGDLVHAPGSVYRDRLLALPSRPSVPDPDGGYIPPAGMAAVVSGAGMRPVGDEPLRWAPFVGMYRTPIFGVIDPTRPPERFLIESGVPYFDAGGDGPIVRHRMTEIEPSLFLADNGETLDLRSSPPTWRNLDLVRVTGGPAAWQWAIVGSAGIVAASWLVAAAILTLRHRAQHVRHGDAPTWRRWRIAAAVVGTLAATSALGAIALVAALPGLVDSGFLGWLEVPIALRLAMHLPLVLAVATGCLVVLTVFGWAGRWSSGAVRLRYATLSVAAIALVVQLSAWGLIGWGLT